LCAVAPLPPNPLLPHGEKVEFGRPEAQNERRNAGASQKTYPCTVHKRPTRLPTRGARSPTAWVRGRPLSKGAFLGAIPGLRHSRARLPLFPPTPFSHTGRRGSLGVLMAETGDGTQGLAKKSTPVRYRLGGIAERFTPDGARQPAQADFAFHSRGLYSCGSSRYRISFSIFMFAHRASPA